MTGLFLIAALAAISIVSLVRRGGWETVLTVRQYTAVAVVLLVGGMLVRIFVGYHAVGYATDIQAFKSWAQLTDQVGFAEIYKQNVFLDYPPGYLYVLVLLEKLRNLFGIDAASPLFTLMIKLPSILGDLFAGGAIFYLGARHKRFDAYAIFAGGAYLFCPAVIQNSAQWGQADSFCLALLLCAVFLFYREHDLVAAALYGVSILCKPQMLVFVPMFIFALIRRRSYIKLLLCPLAAIATILLISKPFTSGFDYGWLIQRYQETMHGYDYYSVNAYNFWALIGKNWAAMPTEGLAATLPNIAGPALATLACAYLARKAKRKEYLFACPIVLMGLTFLLTVKMHERYLYPILIFTLILYYLLKDYRLMHAFAGVSFIHFLNVGYVLYLNQMFGANYNPNEPLVKILALAQIAVLIYLLFVIYRIFLCGEVKEKADKQGKMERTALRIPSPSGSPMEISDWGSISLLCLVYSAVAFIGIGAIKTAVTPWTPMKDDQVTLVSEDYGDTICFIPGIAPDNEHYRSRTGANVKLEISSDGKEWKDAGQLEETGVFAWRIQSLERKAKYLRLTALDDEVCINEFALLQEETDAFLPLQPITGETGADMLIDEQEKAPRYPNNLNSTYFDEIYHVRTAYEHIQGLEPYENTHPPLGKLIISVGIRLFGMNPFGWRFMGVLFGILMIPALYHLLKQLFGNLFICTTGCWLFAFDFMHFTQTRVATIDTYAVFFILLMYDAMVVFLRKDIETLSIKKLLPSLGACGVFMGIGIASKWTVAYGAVGLALLLFGKLASSLKNVWKDMPARAIQIKKTVVICLWCILLFLVIPSGIYFLAFLPQTMLPHNQVVRSFFTYQQTMYDYHATLVAEHYFSSPWYEWPFVIRPIWYAVYEHGADAAKVQSITAMGSPALWWPMIPTFGLTLASLRYRRSLAAVICVVGLVAVYLPWTLISRITFIYHYFTAIPFLIIGLCVAMHMLLHFPILQKKIPLPVLGNGNYAQAAIIAFVALNLVLFVVFYPVISGYPVERAYLNALEWLPQWHFI